MSVEKKTFARPDEVRPFRGNGRMEVLAFGDTMVGRGIFEPGWRWSEHVKPIANTESCQAAHTIFVLQGRMHIRMDNGDEMEIAPGDVVRIPPGHDAWVVGHDTCVALDFSGAEHYAHLTAQAEAQQPSV